MGRTLLGSNRGYASFHALVIMVFATMAGAYLLRSVSKDAGTSGSYYQMRSAAVSADAGLNAGVAQLVTDTAQAMSILGDYEGDSQKRWMLGAGGATASANLLSFGTGQKYSARIVDFDPVSGLIKLEAQGSAAGGSAGRVTGIFRLEGTSVPSYAATSTHALFIAGDARASAAPIIVTGSTYFGGGLNLGVAGSDFDGTFKTAAFGNAPLVLNGSTTFRKEAYFETPVVFQSGTATFQAGAGFDDDATLTASPRLSGAGAVYANGLFTGLGQIDLGSNPLTYSEMTANVARVRNASTITSTGDMIEIAPAMGFNPGEETEMAADFSAIPAAKVYNLARLDAVLFAYAGRHIGATITARDFVDAFHGIPSGDRFGVNNLYVAVDIDRDITLVGGDADALPNYVDHLISHDDDDMYKWFVARVRAKFDVNGVLWRTASPGYGRDAAKWGDVMFVVENGGTLANFGGDYPFKGYINVKGTGSVSYKWGPSGRFDGAIHQVSAASGFSVIGPNPMKVVFDQSIMDDYLAVPGLITVPPAAPAAGTTARLNDARIRPRFVGLYY